MTGDAVGHLLVLVFLIDLLVGTWAAIVIWQRYQRHGISQLRHFFNYVVTFNLMVMGYLVAQYAFTNLIGQNPLEFPRHVLVMSVGVYPIEAALAWTALRLSWDLRRRELPAHLRAVFIACATAFGLSYAVGIAAVFRLDSLQWLVSTHMVLGLVMTTVLIFVFISLVALGDCGLNRDQRRSVRGLGWYLLLGYLFFAGSAVLPHVPHLFSLAGALLWLNCVPIMWLRFRFDLYHQSAGADEDGAVITRLAQEYGISPREREVMELIVLGKSNKEIEQQLYISFSTVKNHAYSLYRKMGVKSRAQLIHMVMVSAARSDEDTGGCPTNPLHGS